MPEPFRSIVQTVTIQCVKCQAQLTIHQPMLDMHLAAASTVYMLGASWSLDERVCRGCGAVYAPILRLQMQPGAGPWIDWTVVQTQEPSRIVLPKFGMQKMG